MAEYLAPGVYVEETSFRGKSIEGVSTSTTGFVGPTLRGPVGGVPELITSFGDFQRIYGGVEPLGWGTNYLAHAVQAFFNNEGARLFVARAFTANGTTDPGTSSAAVIAGGGAASSAKFVSRFPGAIGNGTIAVTSLYTRVTKVGMDRAPVGALLRVGAFAAAGGGGGGGGGGGAPATTYFVKRADGAFADSGGTALSGTLTNPGDEPAGGAELVTVSVSSIDRDGYTKSWDQLGLDKNHPRYIGAVMATTPTRRAEFLENQFALEIGATVTAFDLKGAFVSAEPIPDASSKLVAPVVKTFALAGGNDGAKPGSQAYADGLQLLEQLEDISIVAAPGYSDNDDTNYDGIQQALIGHAEKRRAYRIAVLDAKPDQAPSEIRASKSKIDSTYAALYYPWVIVANPLSRPGRDDIPKELALPASGFVSGIYARSDVQRGVFKAPANETLTGVVRFQSEVNFATQETLNPLGINCLRSLPNRGNRVWGARTISSDPEWKYVNVRRYFNYVERSIDIGTQWAVFEPNGPRLWANIRDTIGDFLYTEWRNGALLGDSIKEAAFVKCDRTTMDQNDLDNGRLVCLIGIAVIKPAEFVIFRIGQKTADART